VRHWRRPHSDLTLVEFGRRRTIFEAPSDRPIAAYVNGAWGRAWRITTGRNARMRHLLLLFMIVCFAPVSAVGSASAAGSALIVKESRLGVKETADALAAALEAKGVKVVARIDHAAGAKAVGMELRPTEVIIFGNPKLGAPLMQADQRAGLDLPMKALVWQDADGKVFIGYADPATLKDRYRIEGRDDVLKAMARALDAFSASAAGK
jgi:uncharacterized protein (DUF302 family)